MVSTLAVFGGRLKKLIIKEGGGMKFAVMLICVFFINAPGQTAQTNNSDDIFYDDCFIDTQPEAAPLIYDYSGTKQIDYFDNKWTVLASTSYRLRSTRAEISEIDNGRKDGLEADSNPIPTYFDKVVSWIKETYHARVAEDNYGSTRLLLLSFGLIGLVGIRRKLKKRRSAQISSEKDHWILGKNKKDWILRRN
jgi:hypothetical protein